MRSGPSRVLAGDRARLVHRRQRVGCEQGDRAQRVGAHRARRSPAVGGAPAAVRHQGDRSALAPGCVPAGARSTSTPRASCPTRSRCSSTRRSRSARSSTTCSRRSRRLRRRCCAARRSIPGAMPDDIELPRKFPQSVVDLAKQITAGATGPYDQRDRSSRTSSASRATSRTRSTPTSTTRPTPSCSSFQGTARLLRAVRGVVRGHGARRSAYRPASRSATSRERWDPTASSTSRTATRTRGPRCGSTARAGSRSSRRPRSASRHSASAPADRKPPATTPGSYDIDHHRLDAVGVRRRFRPFSRPFPAAR